MADVKDLPNKLKKVITEDQYKLLMAILDTLNEGRKPNITKITEELGLSYNYNHYLEGQTFRNALRNVLESAIDIDTLIELKYRLANDDVSTTTLAKLYLEKNRRAGGVQSFEDMVSEDVVDEEIVNEDKEDEDADRNTHKPDKPNKSKSNKPVSNVVSSINVPRVIQ